MVKYQRKNMRFRPSKGEEFAFEEDEESRLYPFGLICGSHVYGKKTAKLKILYFLLLFLVSCILVLGIPLLFSSFSVSMLHSFRFNIGGLGSETDANGSICSSVPDGNICCDRSSNRSDMCIMRGDIRTHSASSSVFLYRTDNGDDSEEPEMIQHEKIRPYSRKWETSVMDTIDELHLILQRKGIRRKCNLQHNVTAVFFSTGGYTGNLYHEFNDGILPLYITSQHFNKKVVFVILERHDWWITKYGDILSQLTDFPIIDFNGDKRIHCFPEAIVGLRIHNELTIDASLMENNTTIGDFHDLLDRAYWPRIRGLIEDEKSEAEMKRGNTTSMPPKSKNPIPEEPEAKQASHMPKLVIVSRNGSRAITNEDSLVIMAEGIGFTVEVLIPERTTELAKFYRILNSSDVMIGVHGAAMTHFLFMKPGSVFIQVIPLGTDWAAETYYGEPAKRFDLRYMGYTILPKESSLYNDYDEIDPVLIDPSSVNAKGWEFTKKIYLDRQTVKLDLIRFRKYLHNAYYYTLARKKRSLQHRLNSSFLS